jgi:hypothetical protein
MPQPYFIANGLQAFFGAINAYSTTAAADGYYYLPYNDTSRILIQWGARPATNVNTIVTFKVPYASGYAPTAFCQPTYTNAYFYQATIYASSNNSISIDPTPSTGDKRSFNWIAIGLV